MIPLLGDAGFRRAVVCLLVVAVPGSQAVAAAWFEGGRPTERARQAVRLMADAASHGLEPQDYSVPTLELLLTRAGQPASPNATVTTAEQALSRAWHRFLTDLHLGRVDPATVGQTYRVTPDERVARSKAVAAAMQQTDPQVALSLVVPQTPQYTGLMQALAQYRQLAQTAGWERRLPALPPAPRGRPKLEAGQVWSGLQPLAQRLRLMGDIGHEPLSALRYEGELLDGVRRFQVRHGLEADGTLGANTLAALEVTPAARVRQLELALERLRWTPRVREGRQIEVNLPEYVLRAYQVHDSVLQQKRVMKVIVGQAPKHNTPVFDQDLRFVEFSPYWNVPYSIARNETVPKLRQDPGHWIEQGFEFVRPDGSVERELDDTHLQAVLAGRMRLRQRPGPSNALGSIKFVFPNQDNIYLHFTPSMQLFARDKRDFSHGCIRVEHPQDLAEFVLQDMPGWSRERIAAVMEKGETYTLRLNPSVPVVLSYGTSRVEGDQIYFYRDVYGLDRVLDQALRHRTRPPKPDLQ